MDRYMLSKRNFALDLFNQLIIVFLFYARGNVYCNILVFLMSKTRT